MTVHSAPPLDRKAICPRCGSDPAGAVWCPQCGLNLRLDASAPPPLEDPRPARSSPALVAGILVLILVAVGVTLVVALPGGGAKPRPVTPRVTPTTTASATAPEPTVTAAAMERVLHRYADAYSSEDVDALGSLFSSDFERVNGSDLPEIRSEALATYASQFSQLDNPRYSLSGLTYDEGATTGVAAGNYRITSASGVHTGGIAFSFARVDGALLIDHITTEPLS